MNPRIPRPRAPLRTAAGGALLFALLCFAALPGRSGVLEAAGIRETLFPSGLRLVVREAHAVDLAAVQVWIRAGGFTENAETSGTAHVLEHLLFRSEASDASMVDEEIENLGGLVEATTEKDWTRFACTVSGRYVARAIRAIAAALSKPTFRPEALEAEKPILLQELQQLQTRPDAIVTALLYQLAYQKHPYRFDVRGTPARIRQIDVKALQDYYAAHYRPENMTVVVVGDVDPAGVEREVRATFGADRPAPKPAGEAARLPEPERACSRPERRVIRAPFTTGYLGMAFPAPSVRDPEIYAMDVLLTLLESGGVGRLPKLLENIGGVRAIFETRRQPGLFTVIAAAPPAELERVEALLRREIGFLAERPVPEMELAFAKRTLRGAYLSDNETYSGQASTLGYYAAIDRWQFASDYLQRVEAVTAEQVREAARKYLRSEECVVVLLQSDRQPDRAPNAGARRLGEPAAPARSGAGA